MNLIVLTLLIASSICLLILMYSQTRRRLSSPTETDSPIQGHTWFSIDLLRITRQFVHWIRREFVRALYWIIMQLAKTLQKLASGSGRALRNSAQHLEQNR